RAGKPDLLGSATRLPEGQAETQVASPVVRRVPVALRRPGVAGEVEPAPAAEHPVRGPRRARRILHRRILVIVGRIPVPTPLPDVTQHVVESPRVWSLLTDRVSLMIGILIVPRVLSQPVPIVAEGITHRAAGAASIFPLCLSG